MINLNDKRSDQIGLAILLTLAALIIFLVATTFGWSGDSDDYPSVISVTGEGKAFVVPDTATFSYSIEAEAATAKEAQAQMAENARAILASLLEAGVAESDIKTVNYNVYPRYEYRELSADSRVINPPGERVLVGYEAIQTNQVRVRQVDSAGDLLALTTDNGASNVSSLDFIVWDEAAVEAEAREEAITEAKGKARELADQLGVKLGDIRDFSEGGHGYPIAYDQVAEMRSFDMDGAGGGLSKDAAISLGENEVRKTVTITFEIK